MDKNEVKKITISWDFQSKLTNEEYFRFRQEKRNSKLQI